MSLVRLARALRSAIPQGSQLSDQVWRRRHHGILVLLWLQAIGVTAFSLATGQGLAHSAFEGGLVAAAAVAATLPLRSRALRASAAAVGLIASSAIFVHLWGGYIEGHFHYFVMVGLLVLYEEWAPFLVAIAFVLLHHGVIGVLDPSAVYNHPAAIAHPWRWALIHALFIAAMSVVSLVTWRVNETSRALAQLLLTSAGEAIIGLDLERRVTFVNDAAVKLFGWHHDQVIGQPFRALSLAAGEKSETFWRPDGTTVSVGYVSTPIMSRGAMVGTVLVLNDITERQQLFEESERRRAAAEGLAELSRLVSQSLDVGEVAERITESVRTLLGVTNSALFEARGEELVSLSLKGDHGPTGGHAIVYPIGSGAAGMAAKERRPIVTSDLLTDARIPQPPEQRARMERAPFRAVLAVPLLLQERMIGVLVLGDRVGRVFADEEVRLVQAFADQAAIAIENARLHRETQERVEELRTRESRLQALLAVDRQMSRIRADDSLLSQISEACGRFFDAHSVSFRLIDGSDLLLCGSWGPTSDLLSVDRVKVGEGSMTGHVARSGEPLIVDDPAGDRRMHPSYREAYGRLGIRAFMGVPLKIDGQVIGVLTIRASREGGFVAADLEMANAFAAQAAIALENSRLYQQAQRAFEELSKTKDQLVQAQKMEAVGQLAGGVAHDFNNLLTVISGRSRLFLARVPAGDPNRRDVELIDRAADRAAGLTRQLLAFSRKQLLQPKALDLNGLVGGLAPMLTRLIGEDIELVIVPGRDIGQVMADPGQIEQVIMNLVVNARDAMPEGGMVKIDTATRVLETPFEHAHGQVPAGRYVVLTVQDSGCGMDAATLGKIFEPFFTTKEKGKGTGLGLATVYGIVHQSGGAVGVDSAKGRGTTFTIYLPRIDTKVEAAKAPAGQSLVGGNETILLVEDDHEVRALTAEVLKACGYTVIESGDPLEALVIGERHRDEVRLLLSDMVMPAMRGPALAAEILRLQPAVRVMYMSGYTEEVVASSGTIDPPGPLLQKPFAPDVLARTVRGVLDADLAAR